MSNPKSPYIVKAGESIWDVCLNSCGALVIGSVGDPSYFNNLDAILTANGMTDWTPILTAGMAIIIPNTVSIDSNALQQLLTYPVCNNSVSDVLDQIQTIFATLGNNWILSTGIWNGDALWLADGIWNPGN